MIQLIAMLRLYYFQTLFHRIMMTAGAICLLLTLIFWGERAARVFGILAFGIIFFVPSLTGSVMFREIISNKLFCLVPNFKEVAFKGLLTIVIAGSIFFLVAALSFDSSPAAWLRGFQAFYFASFYIAYSQLLCTSKRGSIFMGFLPLIVIIGLQINDAVTNILLNHIALNLSLFTIAIIGWIGSYKLLKEKLLFASAAG